MGVESPDRSGPVLANLQRLLPNLESIYADVHAHPELSMQETRTAALAAERLRSSSYEVTTGVGNTGVVGLLRNGEGPTVMLRADMDALPVEEATGSDPDMYAKAEAANRINEIPINHNPRFLPVIHPTLEVGVEALVVATLAWLPA